MLQAVYDKSKKDNMTLDQAKETGAVYTLLGRRRKLPDIKSSNQMIRGNAERMAMNSPIQGTAADLIKVAMIQVQEKLESGGYAAKLTVQVHDELLLDCPKSEVEAVTKLVTVAMEGALKTRVPLKVNVASGANWMELS